MIQLDYDIRDLNIIFGQGKARILTAATSVARASQSTCIDILNHLAISHHLASPHYRQGLAKQLLNLMQELPQLAGIDFDLQVQT